MVENKINPSVFYSSTFPIVDFSISKNGTILSISVPVNLK